MQQRNQKQTPKYQRESFFQPTVGDNSASSVASGLASLFGSVSDVTGALAENQIAKGHAKAETLGGQEGLKAKEEDRLPTFSDNSYASSFNKGAIQSYGIEVKHDFRDKLLEFADEHKDDPEAFRDKATASMVGSISGLPKELSSELSLEMNNLLEKTSLKVKQGFLDNQRNEHKANVENDVEERTENVTYSAWNGEDTTEEVQLLFNEIDKAVDNKIFAPDVGEKKKRKINESIVSEAFMGGVKRILDSDNLPQAIAHARAEVKKYSTENFDHLDSNQRDILIDKANALIDRKERKLNKVVESTLGTDLVEQAINGDIFLDSENPDHQKYVATYYDNVITPLLDGISEPEARKAIETAFISSTSVIPEQIATRIRGKLQSGNVDAMVDASDMVDRIQTLAHSSLNIKSGKLDLSTHDLARAMLINDTIKGGGDKEYAVDLALKTIDPRNASQIAMNAKLIDDNITDKYGDWVDDYIDEKLDTAFTFEPSLVNVDGLQGRITNDFINLFESHFKLTGDKELSKELTNNIMENKWGKTDFGNQNRVMAYPPEKFYSIGGDDEWMTLQFSSDMTEFFPDSSSEDIENMLEEGEIYMVSDYVTAREAGAKAQKPSYRIVIKKNGSFDKLMSGDNDVRWRPNGKALTDARAIDAYNEALRKQAIEKARVKFELEKAINPFSKN